MSKPNYEIQKTLVVSTAHMHPWVRDWLDGESVLRANTNLDYLPRTLVVDPIGAYGWRICLTGEKAEGLVERYKQGRVMQDLSGLSALIDLAQSLKCDWLAIDRDGPVVEGFRVFEEAA